MIFPTLEEYQDDPSCMDRYDEEMEYRRAIERDWLRWLGTERGRAFIARIREIVNQKFGIKND